MKTRILLMTGMLLLAMSSANAQLQPSLPLINVSGSAEVKVAPDEVNLSVSVVTRDESLDVAKQRNDERVAKALKFLKDRSVPEKDIQTDYISIEPVFDQTPEDVGQRFDPLGLPVPDKARHRAISEPMHYVVRKNLSIRLTEMGRFDGILAGLIKNGVNQVLGIEFRTSELRKQRDKARSMAIHAAKEKAEAMAAELGVKVGRPYTVNVNESGGSTSWSQNGQGFGGSGLGGGGGLRYQNSSLGQNGGSGEMGTTFSAGQISISASVDVSFLIQ